MSNRSVQDSQFIDMKYIVLYRKLGFKEISQDVYGKRYKENEIIIESETQRFSLNNNWYELITYKDMVLLECIDRLLELSYGVNDLMVTNEKELLVSKMGSKRYHIYVSDWGRDFIDLMDKHKEGNQNIKVLYTSRLSGGLIDFKYIILENSNIFNRGIFEFDSNKYNQSFEMINNDEIVVRGGFEIKHNKLINYVGNEKEVFIPNGIEIIGTGAFWNNMFVEKIVIPNTVCTIEGDAFVYCEKLKEAVLPCSVKQIGDNPFAGCPMLELECETDYFVLENGVLFDRSKNILIHYSMNKKESKYTIPKSVEWIGKHGFYKCEYLYEVVITENVSFMGNNVFSDCTNIELINLSPYFKYCNGVLYNSDVTQVYHYSMGSGVEHVVIEEGVRTIGRNSFWNAKQIITLTIPNSVRQIGYNPFANCSRMKFINKSPFYRLFDGILYTSSLDELVCCTKEISKGEFELSNKLIRIGRNAFVGCDSMKEITLPKSVKYISRGAFSGCTSLTSIVIPKNIKEIGDWAFNECFSLKEVIVPENIELLSNTFMNSPAKVVKLNE